MLNEIQDVPEMKEISVNWQKTSRKSIGYQQQESHITSNSTLQLCSNALKIEKKIISNLDLTTQLKIR